MPVSRVSLEDISLQDIYEFMEYGSPKNAPTHIVEYLELLDVTRSLTNRIDQFATKEAVLKHLMVHKRLSRYKADKIYEEAIEYFYVDKIASKQARRNMLAQKMEKALNFAMLTMKDASDAKKVVEMAREIGQMWEVHVPDEKELDESIFQKPVKLFSFDPAMLEYGGANREKIAALIDAIPDITDKEKDRIKQEALVKLPIKIWQDEQEDIRKNQ